MTSAELDLQRERAARNQAICRDVNERIDELNERFGGDHAVPHYLCECLDLTCGQLLAIPHDEYLRIRRNPIEFLVLDGHEDPQVEEVVHRDAGWVIVRKLGVGARVAAELAEPQASG